jgi:ABC-type xylose transport system permease subunit
MINSYIALGLIDGASTYGGYRIGGGVGAAAGAAVGSGVGSSTQNTMKNGCDAGYQYCLKNKCGIDRCSD